MGSSEKSSAVRNLLRKMEFEVLMLKMIMRATPRGVERLKLILLIYIWRDRKKGKLMVMEHWLCHYGCSPNRLEKQ